MWMDAEPRNKFLEDLLHEYAIKLDTKDKTIQKLKTEIRSLNKELEYYRAHSFPGSIYSEPPIVEVPKNKNISSFNLAVPSVEVSLKETEDAYHIVAKISSTDKVNYNYYITKEALLTAKDKIGMLTYLHKKVLEEMDRQLKNSS